MDSDGSRDYVLLEGWSEVATFQTISEALRFQEFMENLHPRRKFDVCLKRGGFMRLRAGGIPAEEDQDKDPLEWLMLIALKGGGEEHGRRNEVVPSDKGGRPGELSQGFRE